MMNLHFDEQVFTEMIQYISQEMGISEEILEKDYYVTLLLKELFKLEPNFIFKGGTSLSKCYHVIKRFSEDIDLNYMNHDDLTRRKKKEIKENIKLATNNCGLNISNLDETKSNRMFNQYRIDYPKKFSTSFSLKQQVIVETAFQSPSFPYEKRKICSIIGEYLLEKGRKDLIEKYNLEKFEVNVQSIERTFIDKIFAISDYYLMNNVKEHSRHLYDLYMMSNHIIYDEQFKELFNKVRLLRKENPYSPSSQDDICLENVYKQIIEDDVYKNDYNSITLSICYNLISYEEVKDKLKDVVNNFQFIKKEN